MGTITISDLTRIREEARYKTAVRMGAGRVKMTVHMGTCGIAAGAREIIKAVMREIEVRHLSDVIVTNAGCAGECSQEPVMTMEVEGEPGSVRYAALTPEKVKKIFDSHVVKGEVVKEFVLIHRGAKTHS